jgi:hypothetical protein
MPRLKFDVSGVEDQEFETPKPGTYESRIHSIEEGESQAGNPMLTVIYVIKDGGKYDGQQLWDYITLTESTAWKYKRWLTGLEIIDDGKEKGTLDTDDLINKRVLVAVKNENSKEFGLRARVSGVTLAKGGDDDDIDDLDDDEDLDDELDEDDELTYEAVMKMRKTELKEVIGNYEIEGIRVTKKSDLNKLRERVAEELELEDEDEDEDDEDVEEIDDYNDLSLSDLRAEAKERGINAKGNKRALVKRLEENDEEDEDGEPF